MSMQANGPVDPAAAVRQVIDDQLRGTVPPESRLRLTDGIVQELARKGLLAGSFEWAVRSDTSRGTFTDARAAQTFYQPGDEVHRRATAGPWIRVR